ncbi:MAG: VOC family protein [Caulobacterales bacterium]
MQACRPLFNVADVEASLVFWRDKLGFEETHRFDWQGRLMFAQLRRGDVEIMLNGRGGDPAARRARPHYTEAVFYFRVDDVHALYSDLTAKGLAPTAPETQEYGLDEVFLRDPDGYELSFTSPTPADAQRR